MLGSRCPGRVGVAALIAVLAVLLSGGPSSAQTYVGVPTPEVGASDRGVVVLGVQDRPAPVAARARGAVIPRAQVRLLAFTGGDLVALATVALGAVVLGTVLVRSGRRRVLVDQTG